MPQAGPEKAKKQKKRNKKLCTLELELFSWMFILKTWFSGPGEHSSCWWKGLRKDASILKEEVWSVFPIIRGVFKFFFFLEWRTVLFPMC